ncbi:MAG: branched-chain amino acid ABC transporter permease [Geminicoccales bacterium]
MDLIAFVNFYLVPGIILGSIYALGAVGVSLLFGILRFAHFAHGDLMTFGAYVTLTVVGVSGLSAFLALPIGIGAAVALALLVNAAFYRPLKHLPTIVTVISSFGIALMIRASVQLIWGTDIESYRSGIQKPLILFDTFRIAERHIWIVLITAGLIVLLHHFLARTKIGKAMRAVADDPALASVSGIDIEHVVRWVWVIGGGLAAVAGVFLGIDNQLHTNMGWDLLLPVFAAALLGGIGKPYGAIAGGYVIGIAQELSTYPWLGSTPFVDPGYKSAIAFGILVVMLIWRPQGLTRGRLFT